MGTLEFETGQTLAGLMCVLKRLTLEQWLVLAVPLLNNDRGIPANTDSAAM